MKRKTYDFVLSLGAGCACSASLRRGKLQFASFPFDWLYGAGLRGVSDIVAAGFAGWFEAEDFERQPDVSWSAHAIYRNRKTGIICNHDFTKGVPFETEYGAVRAKYERRIARMDRLIGAAKRVLLVWFNIPTIPVTSADDLEHCKAAFCSRWPEVEFDLLIFTCLPDVPFRKRLDVCENGVRTISFDYREKRPLPFPHAIDSRQMGRWLRRNYACTDYRTPEEKRRYASEAKAAKYRRYKAKSFWGYWTTHIEYKLYRHFRNRLANKGCL